MCQLCSDTMKTLHLLSAIILSSFHLTVSEAAITSPVRFKADPGWFGPLSEWWNNAGDYEESTFTMGVNDYTFNGTTIYRGVTTSIYKHMWLSSNGNEYFTTTYNYGDGTSETNTDPFDFIPEKRNYSCTTSDGVWHNTTTVSTEFWLQHTVTHWANNSVNASPATDIAKIYWLYNTLTSTCEGQQQYGLETTTSKAYQKNQRVTVEVPVDNSEIESYSPGKDV
jgi:hypothetical protein